MLRPRVALRRQSRAGGEHLEGNNVMQKPIAGIRLPKLAVRKGTLALCATVSLFGWGIEARAGGTFTTFDPPGSIATFVHGIDGRGVIAGEYTDGNAQQHGFTRHSD